MIESLERAQVWLEQFPLVDREVARQLLRSLLLISNSQFERNLDEVLERLLAELGDENMTLLTVPELVSEKWRKRHPEKVYRQAGSSSDRLRSYIENFSRVRSKRVRAHQTIESMRSERVRNVVLVEDFIGSGKRIADYLKLSMHPSLKSWISYGWTKLWIVAYGGLPEGVWTIQKRGYKLSDDRFKFVMPASYSGFRLSDSVRTFCMNEAYRTHRSGIPLGFNNGGTKLIFEHGCPNNAPVILWSMGRNYKPLFPNRGIPTELRSAFGMSSANPAEILWDSNQFRLALALLKEKVAGRDTAYWSLPVALGLASRTSWNDAKIASLIGKPQLEVEHLRRIAISLGTLDSAGRTVTSFGKALLDHIRLHAQDVPSKKPKTVRALSDVYYPTSCGGSEQY